MARRYSTSGIRRDRVYTIQIGARLVGVSDSTFRKWRKQGLIVISEKRPYLVRGADLIDFLNELQAANKVPMMETQFYCMKCKAPREALGGMADYTPTTELTGRLSTLCAVCENKCGRFCSTSDLPKLGEKLDIAISERLQA